MTSATNTLPLRPFGRTGFMVTPICVGCAPLGDMPETLPTASPKIAPWRRRKPPSPAPSTSLTQRLYGDGESERRIGIVLANWAAF
ncbi:MAG: hypothetical protein R2856_18340 [Caldilineaceae bacterium]